ncbi:hypothetical protein JSO54_02100 [Riemerella anatipestifer]|uniref:hypothetical protein n=1 Tax=Riemerella anatipestifer TaxID=34085 RepID=UPI001374985D|nr:hypothetical protein [Riemerella anatipestifer]
MVTTYTFPISILESNLIGTRFEINYSFVYFFSSEKNDIFQQINKHKDKIVEEINKRNFEIVFTQNTIETDTLLDVCKYTIPFIDFNNLNNFSSPFLTQLLNLTEIKENIKNAFVYRIGNQLYIVAIQEEFSFNELIDAFPVLEDTFHVLEGVFLNFQPDFVDFVDFDDDFDEIPIDEDTKILVNDVLKKLKHLNKTGQFLTILPFLEEKIREFKNTSKVPLSRLYIDENYRIFLKDYQNREIKMSHLTKSLYFLFLMGGSFSLQELGEYKKELSAIYQTISHQENFDKMQESIERLLANENNEIYIHFSRIKSAFLKVIDEPFAKYYYITGRKNEKKRIDLDKQFTNIFDLQEQLFPKHKSFITRQKIADINEALNL